MDCIELSIVPSRFRSSSGFKGSYNYILFAITAAGVVPCGGPKKSPRTSSIVQIISFFGSFEISEIFGVFQIYCMLRITILTEF